MKKIIVASLLLIAATSTFCQQSNPSPALTKQDYLKKSKHQKTTAWILAGGGPVLFISGIIAYQKGNAGLLLMGAGLISEAASIPFFISSGINKRKAKKVALSFKIEKNQTVLPAEIVYRSYPAIMLKLNL